MNKEEISKYISTRKVGMFPHDPSKLRAVQKGENPIGLTHYPPLNASVFFNVGKYQTLNPQKVRGKSESEGIKNWINFLGDMGDSADITDPSHQAKTLAQKLISPVMNQFSCGSCFACSTAQAISDVFVYNGLQFNPNISPLLLMSCAPVGNFNNHCGGGNPSMLLDFIASNGAASNLCSDYSSFCKSSRSCMNGGGDIAIPDCGCCNPDKVHNKYFVKNKTLAYSDVIADQQTKVNNPPGDSAAVSKIKDHLLKNGTAVTGFFVFQNWMNGAHKNFADTNGVYIDSEGYGAPLKQNDPDCRSGNPPSIQDNPYCFLGGHAVCIVGWGIEKTVRRPSIGDTLTDVPFWFVRNSWGTECLTKGFYKIAMYDKTRNINANSAYENLHYLGMGGVLLFEPADILPFDKPARLQGCQPNDLYNQDEPKNPKLAPEDPKPTPTPKPDDPTPKPDDPTPKPDDPTPKPDDPTPKPDDPTPKPDDYKGLIWLIVFMVTALIILFLIM